MNKQEVNAEARGFISGYIQVFFDGFIDVYELIEGLAYWDIYLEEIEACGILNDLDQEDTQKIVDAYKEVM